MSARGGETVHNVEEEAHMLPATQLGLLEAPATTIAPFLHTIPSATGPIDTGDPLEQSDQVDSLSQMLVYGQVSCV